MNLDLDPAGPIASSAGFDDFNTPGGGLIQGRWSGPAVCRNTISGGAYVTMTFISNNARSAKSVTVWWVSGNTPPDESPSDADRKYFDFVRAAGGSDFRPMPLHLPYEYPRADRMKARVMQDLSGRPSWLYFQPALSGGLFMHIFPVTPDRVVLAMDGSYVVKYDPTVPDHNLR